MAALPSDLAVLRTEIESHRRLARESWSDGATWDSSAEALERVFAAATMRETEDICAGLAMAAELADRYGDIQKRHADACPPEMPNSAHAFLLQRLTATKVGAEIRALIPAIKTQDAALPSPDA